MTPKAFKETTVLAAAIGHFGTRSYIGSLCSHLVKLHKDRVIDIISVISFTTQDETPVSLRANSFHARHLFPEVCGGILKALEHNVESDSPGVADMAVVPSSSACIPRGAKQRKQVLKVLQFDLILSISFQYLHPDCDGRCQIIEVPVNCPLSVVDRTTAETTLACIIEQKAIPMFKTLQSLAEKNYACAFEDKAASNLKAQAALAALDTSAHHLALDCDLHSLSSVQCFTYKPIGDDISGVIGWALAQRPGSSFETLQRQVMEVLVASCRPVQRVRPVFDRHRDALEDLLTMCLPKTKEGITRRHTIMRLTGGNPSNDLIVVYCESIDTFELHTWASELTTAVLPVLCTILQRHRWMNSATSIQQVCLLANFYNLLERVTPRWFLASKVKRLPPIRVLGEVDVDFVEVAATDDSDLDETSEEAKCRQDELGFNYAIFNKKQRRSAKALASTSPGGRLAVALRTLQPQIKLLHCLEDLASTKFAKQEMDAFARTGVAKCRLQVLASGEISKSYFRGLWTNMSSADVWDFLADRHRTDETAHLAFAMTSRAACGVKQTLSDTWERCPVQIARCLDGEEGLQEVLAIPSCRRGPFGSAFLKDWEGKYTSRRFRVTLWQLFWLARKETGFLECRHAALRRGTRKSQTWAPAIQDIAADVFLMRQRIVEKRDKALEACKAQGKIDNRAAHTWRAFCKSFLRQKPMKNKEQRRIAFGQASAAYAEVRAAGGDEDAKLQREAEAARVSHACGGKAFSVPPCKRRKTASTPELVDDASTPMVNDAVVCEALVPVDAAHSALATLASRRQSYSREEEYRNHLQGLAKRRQDDKFIESRLVDWRRTHAGIKHELDDLIPGFNHSNGTAEVLPVGMADVPVDYVHVAVPAATIAERCLKCETDPAVTKLKEFCVEQWRERHKGIRSDDLPPIGKKETTVPACFFAGVCMCRTPPGSRLMKATQVFRRVLRQLLPKGSTSRRLYDGGMGVFRIHQPSRGYKFY
jgi:hypothetical protein